MRRVSRVAPGGPNKEAAAGRVSRRPPAAAPGAVAYVVELADTPDLHSGGPLGPCGSDPRRRHHLY